MKLQMKQSVQKPMRAAVAPKPVLRKAPGPSRSTHVCKAVMAPSGLDGLADFIAQNYSGMGKSAMDVMPELKRKGITASGRGFSMGGQTLDAAGIATALRLTARPGSRTASRSASPVRQTTSWEAPSAAPARSAAPAFGGGGSASGLDGLADYLATNYSGMGKSAMDVLPELRRKGITASGSRFSFAGQMLDAAGIASALRLTVRTGSRPSTPSRASRSASPAPSSWEAPSSAPAFGGGASSASGLDGLADFLATNFSGMGKSAMDVLPELRRKGITASGRGFSMGGQTLDAAGVASALRLTPRTASRPSTPTRASRSASPAPSSWEAPSSTPAFGGGASSAGGLDGLADYLATNYSGMGKSAMDVLPELRRKGITASGRGFSMGGQILDSAGVASALRLTPRTTSRPSTPSRASRSASPAPSSWEAPSSAPAYGGGASSAGGLDGLADFLAKNYTGMGKSAMDVLPELKRKGITASGSKFNMGGQSLDAKGIATALRLSARPGGNPRASNRSAAPPPVSQDFYASDSSASSSSSSTPGPDFSAGWLGRRMDQLAEYIDANYEGMGISPSEVLSELRRKGIVAAEEASEMFSIQGRKTIMSASDVAELLGLKARAGNPQSSQKADAAPKTKASGFAKSDKSGRFKVQTDEVAMAGTRWLAAWLAAKYTGLGSTEDDVLPELTRRGIVCSSLKGGNHLFEVVEKAYVSTQNKKLAEAWQE